MSKPVSPEPPERYSLHLVQPGDSWWGISRQYMPDTDPELGVEWISRVNGLDGGNHQAGGYTQCAGSEWSATGASGAFVFVA